MIITIPEERIQSSAAALLRQVGLLHRSAQSLRWPVSSGLAPIVGRQPTDLLVLLSRFEKAAARLEEHGIHIAYGRPLVDRREPQCPECGSEMRPDEHMSCCVCGTEIQWITIEEPDLPYVDRSCKHCGYPYHGLPQARCPECGRSLTVDTEEIEELASGFAPPADSHLVSRQIGMMSVLVPILCILGALCVAVAFTHHILWGLFAAAVFAPVMIAACKLTERPHFEE